MSAAQHSFSYQIVLKLNSTTLLCIFNSLPVHSPRLIVVFDFSYYGWCIWLIPMSFVFVLSSSSPIIWFPYPFCMAYHNSHTVHSCMDQRQIGAVPTSGWLLNSFSVEALNDTSGWYQFLLGWCILYIFSYNLEADFDGMAIAIHTMRIESQTMIDHTAAEARSGVTAIVVWWYVPWDEQRYWFDASKVHRFRMWLLKQTAMAIENLDRRVVAEGHRDDMVQFPAVIRWYKRVVWEQIRETISSWLVCSFVFQRILLMERSLTSSKWQFGH